MATTQDERLDFRRIFPVFLVVLVDLLGLTIIIPLLPLYAASFQASPLMIGVLGATYPAFQFVGAPILGRLSDRYGRKPILVVSLIGTLIGFLLLGFADTLLLLFLSRLIDGFSGGNIATAQAMITDSTTEKTRTQGLGLIGAAFGLGFTVGPVIAFVTLALTNNNYHAPAFVAAFFTAVALLLTVFVPHETHPPARTERAERSAGPSWRNLFGMPQVAMLLGLMFAQQFAFGGFEQIIPLFTVTRLGLDARGNALLFVFIGIIVVLVQGYFLGKWSRRFGDHRLVVGGLVALAIGLALSAVTPRVPPPWYDQESLEAQLSASAEGQNNPVLTGPLPLPGEGNKGWSGILWLLAAMVPASIGGGILSPSVNSLITKRVSARERGTVLGMSTASVSLANIVAPLVGGALFQFAGDGAPIGLWAALLGVLALLGHRQLRAEPGSRRTI